MKPEMLLMSGPLKQNIQTVHDDDWLCFLFFSFSNLRRSGALDDELYGDLDPGCILSELLTFGVTGRMWLMDRFNGISSDPSLIKGSARNTVKQF